MMQKHPNPYERMTRRQRLVYAVGVVTLPLVYPFLLVWFPSSNWMTYTEMRSHCRSKSAV